MAFRWVCTLVLVKLSIHLSFFITPGLLQFNTLLPSVKYACFMTHLQSEQLLPVLPSASSYTPNVFRIAPVIFCGSDPFSNCYPPVYKALNGLVPLADLCIPLALLLSSTRGRLKISCILTKQRTWDFCWSHPRFYSFLLFITFVSYCASAGSQIKNILTLLLPPDLCYSSLSFVSFCKQSIQLEQSALLNSLISS